MAIFKGRGVARAKSQVVAPVKRKQEARVVGRVGTYMLYNVVALGYMARTCPLTLERALTPSAGPHQALQYVFCE